ncbi:MAG TPA: hypothetical protein VG965_04365 [Patescibacteria group bacterium]|nr:hypothetical protein [Patescibacteria group bacterium]
MTNVEGSIQPGDPRTDATRPKEPWEVAAENLAKLQQLEGAHIDMLAVLDQTLDQQLEIHGHFPRSTNTVFPGYVQHDTPIAPDLYKGYLKRRRFEKWSEVPDDNMQAYDFVRNHANYGPVPPEKAIAIFPWIDFLLWAGGKSVIPLYLTLNTSKVDGNIYQAFLSQKSQRQLEKQVTGLHEKDRIFLFEKYTGKTIDTLLDARVES